MYFMSMYLLCLGQDFIREKAKIEFLKNKDLTDEVDIKRSVSLYYILSSNFLSFLHGF